jgi:hypothetical protein
LEDVVKISILNVVVAMLQLIDQNIEFLFFIVTVELEELEELE